MRIAFLNPQGNFDSENSYWTEHPDFGGQLVYVKELASAMAEMGIKTDILTRKIIDSKWPEFEGEQDVYEGIDNLRILRIPCGPDHFLRKEDLWLYLDEWSDNIIKFYKKEGNFPDFLTGHYGDGGIACALISEKEKIPYSFTAHSLGALKMDKLGINRENINDFERIFHFSKRLAAERISMKYSCVNFVSTEMERFEQYGHQKYENWIDVKDDAHFKIVPPGVNRKIFNEFKSEDDQTACDSIKDYEKPLIILSSRIDAKKNHIGVIKSFAKDKELREKAHLLIVVRGIQDVYKGIDGLKDSERKIVKEWLAYIKEFKLKNHISFYNAENQSDLAALYRSAKVNHSIFCNPAVYEPFGLTVIEAMSCGLPVAATRNGGPSEILRENGFKYGFLFDPEDVDSIIATLKKSLMSDKTYKKFSELSVLRVLEKYTWKKTAEDYLKEIKSKLMDFKPKEIDLKPFFKTLDNWKKDNGGGGGN